MTTETLTRDNLIQGAVTPMTVTVGASQTIVRGALLELAMTPEADTEDGAITVTAAETFVAPSGAANIFSIYAVAAEDVTTGSGETAKITAYVAGVFDEGSVTYGGASDADDNRFVLAKQGIILRPIVAA